MMATGNGSQVSFSLEVPMDLIFDILSRLSVEPLVRFKSVCKSWYALLENPDFIKAQLLTTSDQNKLLCLLSIDEDYHTQQFTIRLHSSEKTHSLATRNPNFLFKKVFHVVGICNGLVCSMFGDSEAIICNPTIGRLHKTPRFNFPITRLDSEFLGFVFHDNDYKLFKIIYPCDRLNGDETLIHGELYSMSSDSLSNIEVKNGFNIPILNTTKCFWSYHHPSAAPLAMNEVLYWVLRHDSCVAYFDMKCYVFGLILFPTIITEIGQVLQLVDLKGQLTLIILFRHRWIESWVFEEKERSWKMMHTTQDNPLIPWNLNCLGCDRNDKLVLTEYACPVKGELKVFLYDQETTEITNVPFSGTTLWHTFYLYTKSLIWHGVK